VSASRQEAPADVRLDGDEMPADADDGDAGHVSGTYIRSAEALWLIERHQEPRNSVLFIGFMFLDWLKARLLPRRDRSFVREVRVHREPSQHPRLQEPSGHRACGVWTKATATCGRDQEHVHSAVPSGAALEPYLQVSDRLTVPYDDVGVDVGASESDNHLFACERLPIPVPSHIRVRMPSDKEVNVVRRGRSDRGEGADKRCVRGSHSTTLRRVESRQPRRLGDLARLGA
jgi:hypothetical protein